MINRLFFTIITMLLLTFSSAVAADFSFKCAECHDSPKGILPAKHISKEKFNGCFDCHQDAKKGKLSNKVHSVHLPDMGTETDTCNSCHTELEPGLISVDPVNGYAADTEPAAKAFTSYYHEETLANSHKKSGLNCGDCHTTYDYDELDNMAKKCINCHGGYEDVAKRTAESGYETNPHKSHFPTLACTKCHSMHGDFTDYCSVKCHKWGFAWKQKIKE